MDSDARWNHLIAGIRSGDERVIAEFCDDYGDDLRRFADRHIAPLMRRRMGAASVVQSVCFSFLRRAREGDYEIDDAESLWRLLCSITLRKVREKARFHLRHKRGIDREENNDGSPSRVVRFEPPSPEPAPDEALVIAEELQSLIQTFNDEERQIVEFKLKDRSNSEIARELGTSERTVRRLLSRVRSQLLAADAAGS